MKAMKNMTILIGCLLLVFLLGKEGRAAVFFEGSYELQNRSGATPSIWLENYRPDLTPWATNLNLPRATTLFIDVLNFNEVIDLYGSRHENATDVAIWAPGDDPFTDAPAFQGDIINGGTGFLGSFADVAAVQNIGSRPRAPLTYTPSAGLGVYTIIYFSLAGGGDAAGSQYFDVAIRDTKGTPGQIDDILRPGRLFAKHLALNGRNFSARYFGELFFVDGDDMGTFFEGFLWRGDMNGIAPFGFHMYANSQGAAPAVHNFTSVKQGASPTPQMIPEFNMYFNIPEKPVVNPFVPQVSDLIFLPDCSLGSPNGGTFQFETNGSWTYEIVLDENGDGIFDRGTEQTLTGPAVPGENNIVWDGNLSGGSPPGVGQEIRIVLRTRAAEIHFPFFDVENNPAPAGPRFNLFPVDNETSKLYYWDDRPVGGAANLIGSLAEHTWQGGIGNNAIVDTWKIAFEDVAEFVLKYNCTAANLVLKKNVDVIRPDEGDQVQFTVDVLNSGPSLASGITVTDQLPAGLTYVSHSTTGGGSYNSGTGIWTVPNIVVGARDTLFITASVDLGTSGTTITNTATVSALNEEDVDLTNNTASADVEVGRFDITGRIFEDVRYGGGVGRPRSATGTQNIAGVRVELYDQGTGNFIDFQVTDAFGFYRFQNATNGNYLVRVSNATIKSTRIGGSNPNIIPIQTFRTDFNGTSTVAVSNAIGGTDPLLTDAASNSSNANFSTLTSGAVVPQSVSNVTVNGSDVSGIDFGFNFDTIVNTNDSGQGSFRQFVINSNALSNNNLQQVGQSIDFEASIFSIPTSDPNFDGSSFVITLATPLTPISDSRTRIDGGMQSALTGNTNPAVSGITLGPEVIIRGGGTPILEVFAGLTQIANIGLEQSSGLGTNGSAIFFPNSSSQGSVVESVTIVNNATNGIAFGSGSTLISVDNSLIRANGTTNAAAAGIQLNGASDISITTTSILDNPGDGIAILGGSTSITIDQNTIRNNGTGGTGFRAGVAIRGGSSISITSNTIAQNGGDGVIINSGTDNLISQNSIFNNGELGIDLGTGNGGDGVTLNDNNDGDAGANTLLNFPVIDVAEIEGATFTVSGWARPGAQIEFYATGGADVSGFGEGATYLFTFTEGAGNDLDATVSAYSGVINGVTAGADNTNRFEFEASLPSAGLFIGNSISALAINATNNTSEFSGSVTIQKALPKISGTVFNDVNHNAARDGGESVPGFTLFAKLIDQASPATAIQAVSVNGTTGFYQFNLLQPATYTVIIDDNNTVSDVTPNVAAGWLSTTGGNSRTGISVSTADVNNVEFGLFNGSVIRGRSFNDNGAGGGSANDGIQNGTEVGINGAAITAWDSGLSTKLAEAVSNSSGDFSLWLPASVGNVPIIIRETDPSGFRSIAGSGATYNLTNDEFSLTNTPGTEISGLFFGNIPFNVFEANQNRSGLPGTVIWIPHTLRAGTQGSVTFTVNQSPEPSAITWPVVVYEDVNKNGVLDASESQITGPFPFLGGQQTDILLKVTIPSNAPITAKNRLDVLADFAFANSAIVEQLSLIDLLTANNSVSAGLEISKLVDKATALPGQTLTYTISYVNNSSGALNSVQIFDSTPAYTVFSAASSGTLPTGITAINITSPAVGSTGNITWQFVGTLQAGASGQVSYTVTIEN